MMQTIFSIETMAPQLVVIGDSLPVVPAGANWPQQLASMLPGWHIVNLAISGDQSAHTISIFPGTVAPLYDATRAKNGLGIQIGTNDLYFGATVAAVLANIRTLFTLANSAGFSPFVCTLPCSTLLTGATDTKRLELNDLLRAQYGPATLVDIAAAEHRFASLEDAANTTWFADGTHFTTATAKAVARLVAPVVLAAPNSIGSAVNCGDICVLTLPPKAVVLAYQP